jgi:hypothetical protein
MELDWPWLPEYLGTTVLDAAFSKSDRLCLQWVRTRLFTYGTRKLTVII